MELLEHRNNNEVGGSFKQSSLELEVGDVGDIQRCGSHDREGLKKPSEKQECEGMEEGRAGPLKLFHPGEATEERASSIVVEEALRCQVKITTRRSLHLRIANHTARDVYVRLVGYGGRIGGPNGHQRSSLEQSKPERKCV